MYNQTEKVNIRPKSYLPVFRVSQNDVGRTLTAHLVSDEGDISIPGGATVTMAGTKPSGLGYTVTGTVDGTDVSFETDAVMTDEPGRIVSEIRIVQDGTVIGTTNVVLSVEPNPHPDDTTDGRGEPLVNEITALLEQITAQADRVEEYSGKVLNMTVTAHESDEVTVTKTEGEVVNLDFGLPRGPQGIQGIPGEDGEDGVTPDFTIGTVETLAPGEQATATITGTDEDPVLNLGIPQGAKGDKGDTGEVTQEAFDKLLITDTASGEIASFPDGAAFPMRSLKVSLSPIQSGSGIPSPDNVRPISGWDSVDVYNDPSYGGTVAWNQQAPSTEMVGVGSRASVAGARVIKGHKYLFSAYLDVDETLSTNAFISPYAFDNGSVNTFCVLAGRSKGYIYKVDTASVSGVSDGTGRNIDGNFWFYMNAQTGTIKNLQLFDLTAMFGSTIADYIYSLEQSSAGAGVAWFRNLFPKDYYEYNAGEQTTVSAVNGDPYIHITTTLPTTVYGGTLDVVNGTLTVDRGYIASYNGETINEPWISSMDEYISGTTPSTGAQVVYTLATPTSYSLTPQEVQTLLGSNNVWSDGTVEVVYVADPKRYIDKMIGA